MHSWPSVAFLGDMVHQRNYKVGRNMLLIPMILPDPVAIVPQSTRKAPDVEMNNSGSIKNVLRPMKINQGRGTNRLRILYEHGKNDNIITSRRST